MTIRMPEELAAALAREARRRDRSVSEIAREAIARHLDLHGAGPRAVPFAALGRSGHRHTARRMEELVARDWGGGRPRR